MKAWNATLRLGIVLVVLIGMPVLAMPEVNRKVSEWFQTNVSPRLAAVTPMLPAPITAPRPLEPAPAASLIPSHADVNQAAERSIMRTAFEEPSRPTAPPLLPIPERNPGTLGEAKPEEDQLRRVRQIRFQLEELGADYVLLESLDENNQTRFRFFCLMFVAANSRDTLPFEEIAANPQLAAEAVLAKVQQWRRQQPWRQ